MTIIAVLRFACAQIAMHEPGDQVIVTDNGLAVAPGLHTLFDIEYTVVSIYSAENSLIAVTTFANTTE